MNKIVLTALTALTAIVLLTAGCSDASSRTEGKDSPAFMFWCFRKEVVSSEYHIPEMATSAAATYLQSVIRSVPGYESSTTDMDNHILTISYYSSAVRMMNFEEAIALAGFSANGRPANPEGVKRIPAGVK
jgi:hypothetical protein